MQTAQAPKAQLTPEAILPQDLLQKLQASTAACFSCAQLHRMSDQINSLRQLGVRIKVLVPLCCASARCMWP